MTEQFIIDLVKLLDTIVGSYLFVILLTINPIAASLFLPCAWIGVVLGSYYGIFYGSIFAWLGALLSIFLTYALGQKFFAIFERRNAFSGKFSEIRKIANIRLGTSWLETLFYLTNPVFPGGSFGYVLSFSSIKIRNVMLKLLFCTMPGSILTAGIGAKSLDLYRDKTWLASRDLIFILVCFITFSFIIRRFKEKRFIGEETDE
jgi:uncharacterized membrane protein YdjX (TVP38/TMEM64 family)